MSWFRDIGCGEHLDASSMDLLALSVVGLCVNLFRGSMTVSEHQ